MGDELLAERFEEQRGRLRAVAYRMLGSSSEAEDAVQEAWLRLSRSGGEAVDNLAAWLTTVVGRVCLDMLRSRNRRREEPLTEVRESAAGDASAADPERDALLADTVGLAMLVVLDTLEPAERLAFVLHDMFAVPFDEIALIVDRSPAAARQLASRARRRVQGTPPAPAPDLARQRKVVGAFLAAARRGDFEALLTLLDPDVVIRTDMPDVPLRRGAATVARGAVVFSALMRDVPADVVLIDGRVGILAGSGTPDERVMQFTLAGDLVREMEVTTRPEELAALDVRPLP
jgi:RNA polymerase sigma-70 factor (ECF subfamily)